MSALDAADWADQVDVCFDAAGVQIGVDGGLQAVRPRKWSSSKAILFVRVKLLTQRLAQAAPSSISRSGAQREWRWI